MSQLKKLYNTAKSAKVGEEVTCPGCKTKFVKTSYQQAFCKTQGGIVCKDKYWNTVTPGKRNNTTRISAANAAYKKEVILPKIAEKRGFPDVETMLNHVDESDGSWEAHQANVENCEWCKMRPEYCQCD